ncbi:exosortase/archaeosortase family protein, partial [Bacteroidales bacterium OttesenSCG-928-M11]|nr:exosortase/archaeosortase family protein [Bacteroidales bacterium OttesenSCG-928-M11]
EPFSSIFYFLILLFLFHFSWKLSIDGDMHGNYIYLFNKNITPDWIFNINEWLTQAAAFFIHLFPNTDSLIVESNYLYFEDGLKTQIIWGCTGVKQMFIFCGIMIFYRMFEIKKFRYSKEKHSLDLQIHFPRYNRKKWWYIPMGCLALTIYNIIRIGSISLLTRGRPEIFDSLHDGIFRIIYYTIIFMLWVIWEEYFIKKAKKENKTIQQ